mmetsp:Transcript_74069/g.233931  ORF Transcript_74069/g.233931 Transcript_74069/m.233931 type:complete len:202 (-) Transcript_74069:813-1418(-)
MALGGVRRVRCPRATNPSGLRDGPRLLAVGVDRPEAELREACDHGDEEVGRARNLALARRRCSEEVPVEDGYKHLQHCQKVCLCSHDLGAPHAEVLAVLQDVRGDSGAAHVPETHRDEGRCDLPRAPRAPQEAHGDGPHEVRPQRGRLLARRPDGPAHEVAADELRHTHRAGVPANLGLADVEDGLEVEVVDVVDVHIVPE